MKDNQSKLILVLWVIAVAVTIYVFYVSIHQKKMYTKNKAPMIDKTIQQPIISPCTTDDCNKGA